MWGELLHMALCHSTCQNRSARKAAICSLRNLASAELLPHPAVWPHLEGISVKVTRGMNRASKAASSTGKYRSVWEGIYRTGTLIAASAFLMSPPKPGVVPMSCCSQVRSYRIRSLASSSITPFILSFDTVLNSVPGGYVSFHNFSRHQAWLPKQLEKLRAPSRA